MHEVKPSGFYNKIPLQEVQCDGEIVAVGAITGVYRIPDKKVCPRCGLRI